MTSLTITIPLPPQGCKPNGQHGHWAKKANDKKMYRAAAMHCAVSALKGKKPPMWLKAKMQVKAYFMTTNFPDPTNLMASLKAAEDGIQDAGIVANDRGLWPERPEMFKDAKNPRIEITITPE
jgi:hypothetical protein